MTPLSAAAQQALLDAVATGDSSGIMAAIQAAKGANGAPIFIECNTGGWMASDPPAAEAVIAAWNGSAAQLAYRKALALAQLDDMYAASIAAGFSYSVSGGADPTAHVYQIDAVPPIGTDGVPTRGSSQAAIAQAQLWALQVVAKISGVPSWPASFAWADASNVLVAMTAPQFLAFAAAATAHIQAIEAKAFSLRGQLSGAATTGALAQISVTTAWPTSP